MQWHIRIQICKPNWIIDSHSHDYIWFSVNHLLHVLQTPDGKCVNMYSDIHCGGSCQAYVRMPTTKCVTEEINFFVVRAID